MKKAKFTEEIMRFSKSLYLTIRYITRKWSMPIQNWNETMAHSLIKFDGRI